MRIALGLEYDGSAFCGWQTQPNGCGIQDHLQAALASIAGHPIDVVAAGRTDTGVHATAQVVHFDSTADRDDNAWVRGTNTGLSPALRVLWSHGVPDDFHARYSARSRTYRYILLNRGVRPALAARYTGWHHAPLELEPMRAAARCLLGEHDFSAFRAAECQAKNPVRTLHSISIERRGARLDFTLRANAWLQHMVRNIVGALVHVGKGAQPPGWMQALLESRDRARGAPTFGAEGLYLEAVEYESRWGLPEAKNAELVLPVES